LAHSPDRRLTGEVFPRADGIRKKRRATIDDAEGVTPMRNPKVAACGQVPTEPDNVRRLMGSKYFALGVSDARAGHPFPPAYETWELNPQWDYDAAGEFIQQITDPETGEPIATIRRLPGGLLAVDVEGEDALKHFLPPTKMGVATSATGKKKYRFLYSEHDGGAS
jgi:hypothetical protein